MKVTLAVSLLILGQSLASPAFAPPAVTVTTDLTTTEVTTVVDYLTLPVPDITAYVSDQPVPVTVTVTVTKTESATCNPVLTINGLSGTYDATKQAQGPSFVVPPLFSSRMQSAKTTTGHASSQSMSTPFPMPTIPTPAPVTAMSLQYAPPSMKPTRTTLSISSTQSGLKPTTTSETQNGNALPTNTIIQNLKPTDPIYTALALYSHNVHRANHTNTNPLSYNTTLVYYAREKALTCIWDETLPADAVGVGMNLAEGTYIGAANITATIEDMWYNSEISLFPGYGIPSPDMSNFNDWGHFTQVIWKATMSVGCWSSACHRNDGATNEIGSGFFTVCMYYPAGNVAGEYADQVAKSKGRPTVHGL